MSLSDNNKEQLASQLAELTDSQRLWIQAIVDQFHLWHEFKRSPTSDIVNDLVLEHIGDLLRIHHATSRRSLSKAPFEYAFEKALQLSGRSAQLADSSTNPGYDLLLDYSRISLKTEAAKGIKEDYLHVSKWMEIGRGDWDPPNVQLPRFLQHLNGYDRIFSLRCLRQTGTEYWYELLEIPKALMLEAAAGAMELASRTKQQTSPWYCRIKDSASGQQKYALYFDAGSERKLQIKRLLRTYCVFHASWRFKSESLAPDDGELDDESTTLL